MSLLTFPTLLNRVAEEIAARKCLNASGEEYFVDREYHVNVMTGLQNIVGYGGDSQFRGGGDERVGGGSTFSRRKGRGGYHFFQLGRKKIMPFRAF
jgi:hypothetical protein